MNKFTEMLGVGMYNIKVICYNCKEKSIKSIKKGDLIDEVLEMLHCNNCGCQTLQQYNGKDSFKKSNNLNKFAKGLKDAL